MKRSFSLIVILVIVLSLPYFNVLLGNDTDKAANNFYNENLCQKSVLPAPSRGSVAGEFGNLGIQGQDEIGRGDLHFDLPITLPFLRGKILVNILPTYSLGGGLQEFGMGWVSHLSIKRFREKGDIQYNENDSWISSWGVLIRGNDGFWYSKNILKMQSPIKARIGEEEAFVQDEKGNSYFFEAKDTVLRGNMVSWFLLSRVESLKGEVTQLTYERNQSGRPFLKEVEYGGTVKRVSQYKIIFEYSNVPRFPFIDFSTGKRLYLDQRATEIKIFLRGEDNKSWVERYRYHLSYQEANSGIAFYLSGIQKYYKTSQGEQEKWPFEPEIKFNYNLWDSNKLTSNLWTPLSQWDAIVKNPHLGSAIFSPNRSTFFDFDNKGVIDFENKERYTIVKQKNGEGFELDPFPGDLTDFKPEIESLCVQPGYKRSFFRLRGYNDVPSVVKLYGYNWDRDRSEMVICNRVGVLSDHIHLPGKWELNGRTRFVDLNHDGKPDLIKIYSNRYWYIPNLSTSDKIMFGSEMVEGRLHDRIKESETNWILDINGSGFPDIVTKYENRLRAWYGFGNFQFDSGKERSQEYPFINLDKQKMYILDKFEFDFQDVNHDGIMDVILYNKNKARVFINQGDHFREIEVPALQALARYSNLYPNTEDLAGTGNSQINVVGKDESKIISLELSNASTGLLSSIDDGKGNRIIFSYENSRSEVGAGPRLSVLSEVKTESVGYGFTQKKISYSHLKRSPHTFRVLGFNRVLVDYDNQKRETFSFLNNDEMPLLLVKSSLTDLLVPGLISETEYFYSDQLVEGNFPVLGIKGISAIQKKVYEPQNRGVTTQLETKRFLSYNNHLCPTSIDEEYFNGVLKKTINYSQVGAWADFLSCNDNQIVWKGVHFQDHSFDFEHILQTERNSAGSPLEVALVNHEGKKRVLQKIEYDEGNGHLINSIEIPGEGIERYYYDEKRRLTTLVEPIGSTSKGSYLENSDLISEQKKYLLTSPLETFYRYDPLERLQKTWDNLGKNSELFPFSFFNYNYANQNRLGHIEEKKGYEEGGFSFQKYLFSANGKEMGIVKEQRVVDNLKYFIPQENQIITKIPFLFNEGEIENLANFVQFKEGRDNLNSEQSGSLIPMVLEINKLIQQDIKQNIKDEWSLDSSRGLLKRTVLENNHRFTEYFYPRMDFKRPLLFINGNGHEYRYSYDLLGRLRIIELPDHSKIVVNLDDFGMKSTLERDSFQIKYGYDQSSGKLLTELINDRMEKYQWDKMGRMVSKENILGSSSIAYTYYYDGNGPLDVGSDQEKIYGLLTGVESFDSHYKKRIAYRVDGKIKNKKIVLNINGDIYQITQIWNWSKDTSNRLIDKKIEVIKNGKLVDCLELKYAYDHQGKMALISSGNAQMKLSYNSYLNLSKVDFIFGPSIEYSYDELTQNYRKTYFYNNSKSWSYEINYNSKGLIDRETTLEGNKSISVKEHLYDDRKYVESSSDIPQKREEYFSYNSVGLWNKAEKEMEKNLSKFGEISSIKNRLYLYNVAGRVDNVFEKFSGGLFVPSLDLASSWLAKYVYDEEDNPLFKRRVGGEHEIYLDDDVLFSSKFGLIHPILVEKTVVGHLMKDKGFIPSMVDLRNSYLVSQSGIISIPSVYGVRQRDIFNTGRNENTSEIQELSLYLDYALKGYDKDLRLVRMGKRHYSSELGSFTTPDPLFLENPEKCVESPVECNLYSYAGNNPMSYIDSSGLCFDGISTTACYLGTSALVGGAIGVFTQGIDNYLKDQPILQDAGTSAIKGAFSGIATATGGAIGGTSVAFLTGGLSTFLIDKFDNSISEKVPDITGEYITKDLASSYGSSLFPESNLFGIGISIGFSLYEMDSDNKNMSKNKANYE